MRNCIKRVLNSDYTDFLTNVPKISEASRAAMEADLKLEELRSTIKSKVMKDTAPGPDGIPYSVCNKLWEHAGPLIAYDNNITEKIRKLENQ